jgi:TolB-like protein/Tfp pilus assembly protein PilF
MSESSKAVFLSYASEDAGAAMRICEALRSAGIEVWFDKSELRGGDTWDASIRQQIKTCALLIPVISVNTQARHEGYFRLEWNLAVDRSRLIVAEKAFLLPVVIDETGEADALVPDRFRDVQWTRLPAGATAREFVDRVQKLLTQSVQARPAAGAARSTPERFTPGPSRSGRLVIAASVVVLTAALGGFLYWQTHRVTPASQLTATAASIPDKSIAVLPFVDMSENKDQEYFSDGLSEELIDQLTRVPDLRVPGRTSSFFFKGKSEDIASIAQKLRVTHVLEGSVRKSGQSVRVTAQLIRADTGYDVWSQTYDRDLKDIFQLQDEIANAVVEALKAKLLPAQGSASRTANPDAYEQYLLGNQAYNRSNREGWARAVAAYQRAISLDANFAPAYVGLAESEAWLADTTTGDMAALQRAAAAADRAIALAPDLADAYAVRGWLRYSYLRDWTGAQADIDKAVVFDSGSSTVQLRKAGLLGGQGQLPQAIAAAQAATVADPLSVDAWDELGLWLMNDRQFGPARQAMSRARQINPDSLYAPFRLAELETLDGHPERALALTQNLMSPAGRLTTASLAQYTLGHGAEAQRALDALVKDYGQTFSYQLAQNYAWRGEADKAFEWLDRSYAQHDFGLNRLKTDPFLSRIRSDPRYAAMLARINLTP